jgi:hypothetical protein
MTIDTKVGATTRVVYIAGDNRSGTTILSQILGSYDGCLAVGELYDFWAESLAGDRLCSCGAPLRDCEFWNTVMDKTFGSANPAMIQHVTELRRSVQNTYHLPFILFPRIRPKSFDRRLREYIGILERLYTSIQEVSGCEVIVDSSKLAAYALALDESPAIDVNLVHVSRDSRACAYSWRRLKREPVAGDQPRYLRQRPLIQVALVWSIRNMILASISHRFDVSIKLHYEEFVCQPRATMGRLSERLGLGGHDELWNGDTEVLISASNHIFAGNPNRIQHGRTRIRPDDEWRTRMPIRQQRLVFVLTLPAFRMLGYLGARAARVDATGPDRLLGEQSR